MSKRPLYILLQVEGKQFNQVFTDWFDAADYIKQRNEVGLPVTIIAWRYG